MHLISEQFGSKEHLLKFQQIKKGRGIDNTNFCLSPLCYLHFELEDFFNYA